MARELHQVSPFSDCIVTLRDDSIPEEPTHDEDGSIDGAIHYHVSSAHLQVASPVFRAMLAKGNYTEGKANSVDGKYHISASEWDKNAFLIVLNIFHLRNRELPKTVTLEMLAEIAIIVDYYQCHEAVEFYTDMWIKCLRETRPIVQWYDRCLILWMCVAWVFKLSDEFTHTTAIVIKSCTVAELPITGMPLTRFVGNVEQARVVAIDRILSQFDNLLDKYRNDKYVCPSKQSYECGSILFGALTRALDSTKLLHPSPVPPFAGISLRAVQADMAQIKSPVWFNAKQAYSSYASERKYYAGDRHECDLKKEVMEIVDGVVSGVKGLRLEDFGSEAHVL